MIIDVDDITPEMIRDTYSASNFQTNLCDLFMCDNNLLKAVLFILHTMIDRSLVLLKNVSSECVRHSRWGFFWELLGNWGLLITHSQNTEKICLRRRKSIRSSRIISHASCLRKMSSDQFGEKKRWIAVSSCHWTDERRIYKCYFPRF